LRALSDAPDAYGSTFQDASARSPEDWSRQVIELQAFVAVSNGVDVGLVRCARDQERSDTGWLISMWVAPEVRRHGVGAALIDLVVAWARRNDLTRLLLDVADRNAPAIALYERKGFLPNGRTSTMPAPREHVREHQRELSIS